MLYCYIIPVLCFLFCYQRFCISLATLKNPWILNQNALKKKKISKDFLKHLVSDGQMELFVKHKCTFIWCSYHFNTPYCLNLHYPQSKREILCQKEKQYSVNLHDFFVFYAGWTYILRGWWYIKYIYRI